MPDGRVLMCSKDVANYTGYTLRHVQRAVSVGTLKPMNSRRHPRPGMRNARGTSLRFRLADVDAWITSAAPARLGA